MDEEMLVEVVAVVRGEEEKEGADNKGTDEIVLKFVADICCPERIPLSFLIKVRVFFGGREIVEVSVILLLTLT
jgi:hypothetical protein